MSVLERIVAKTRETVRRAKGERPEEQLRDAPLYEKPRRDFRQALIDGATDDVPALIAEVKRASPSKGLIRADFHPLEIARAYTRAGASCLSVLTDEPFFQGHLSFLEMIREALPGGPPLLRKDFIIDRYQLEEARAAGADAVLLIVRCLTDDELEMLLCEAEGLGLQALVEAYDESEVDRAMKLLDGRETVAMLGVNNRDLHTFKVDMGRTQFAMNRLTETGRDELLLVSESGIAAHEDALHIRNIGAAAMLVGESLMRQPKVEQAVHGLLGLKAAV